MGTTTQNDPQAAKRRRALSVPGLLWLGGMGCVGAAVLLVHAGGILFVGSIIASLAPDLFLVGSVLLVVGVLWLFTNRLLLIVPVTIAIGIALGLNSRLPEAWRDLRTDWFSVKVAQKFSGQVGQRLAVPPTSLALAARRFAYATVRQHCRGEQCFATEGFRTLYPTLDREYWKETPASAALDFGFTLAREDEHAPTLQVTTTKEADLLVVTMELRNDEGRVLANGVARYRSSFSSEPIDEVTAETWRSSRLWWRYLLHANVVNRILGPWLAPTVSHPIRAFLRQATVLVSPQDRDFVATVVEQQTLASQRFDPPKILHGGGGRSERSMFFFDQSRNVRCKTLLRPESDGPVMQVWWLFVNDPSRQHKARVTGPLLCDPDAIWFFDYTSSRGHAILTKFDLQGNLLYRVSLKRPAEETFIREPSLHAIGGMLEFEWVTGTHSGHDFRVTAIDRVQVKEPSR